jgi:catechol 2,3-dioxygenase-like lactoylglutathione lyase family enzyme
MDIEFSLTKLNVNDLAALERFYVALGFKVVERRLGEMATGVGVGQGDVAQEQVRLSETGDATSHRLVLSRFINLPEQPTDPRYPGPLWIVLRSPDVEASVAAAIAAGGRVHRPIEKVEDPRYPGSAAIVCDPEGNFIELYNVAYRDPALGPGLDTSASKS